MHPTPVPPALLFPIVSRAMQDPDYRQRLVNDPDGVLAEAAPDLTGAPALRVLQDTATVTHMVLPSLGLQDDHKHHAQLALQHMADLSEGQELRVVRSAPGIQHLVLPAAGAHVPGDGSLSDAELESVSGAGDGITLDQLAALMQASGAQPGTVIRVPITSGVPLPDSASS